MGGMALFFGKKERRRETVMAKENKFATNKGGVIRAPHSVGKDSPKSKVVKGADLRNGTKK